LALARRSGLRRPAVAWWTLGDGHRGQGGGSMHPTAKKCVIWAVCLFVLGALALAWATDLYVAIVERMGANAEVGVAVLTTVLHGVRWALFPTGAALVGAAVVIQALSDDRARVDDGRSAAEHPVRDP